MTAPRETLLAKIERMRREALADGGESGPPTIDYDTLAQVADALASEEPTGPVCTLCGLTLKGD